MYVLLLFSVQPNPFNNSPWQPIPCTQNPFQTTTHSISAGLNKPSVPQLNSSLSNTKSSLPNGNVNSPYWSPTTNNWIPQVQNGQADAFQNKTPVGDAGNPWSQPFGVSGANPFLVSVFNFLSDDLLYANTKYCCNCV